MYVGILGNELVSWIFGDYICILCKLGGNRGDIEGIFRKFVYKLWIVIL